ncbi:hypothetical protein EVAR_26702_1 [Eumeta japonica]|uniref:Uncharacterized protein n=1 Tax=Eumeta variegata TaxID=151549 RepID=A0A4C1ZTI0_EUMVA|nr:hypothetical protein EVAR_26702_1 [Eumeta japonica]
MLIKLLTLLQRRPLEQKLKKQPVLSQSLRLNANHLHQYSLGKKISGMQSLPGYVLHLVHRLRRKNDSALGTVLAVLNKTDNPKYISNYLKKLCGLSGIAIEAPYKRGFKLFVSTNDIDSAIGALTSHIMTVVGNNLRKVPANSDRRILIADVRKLMRVKNVALHRASAYSTAANSSYERAIQHKVRARVQEFGNDNWSTLMEEITSIQNLLSSGQSS